MEEMDGKKKLIHKYEIPLNHLDFVYMRDCKNAREMEKILQILRSGEEGYFPDLTKCAEDKLRELKPNSRLFRYEEQLRGRETLSKHEWKPILDWTTNIKIKDNELLAATENVSDSTNIPPVRQGGIIKESKERILSKELTKLHSTETFKDSGKRIKSTDYNKWNKYDADEECLRMELAEERVQEEVERKNHLNKAKSKSQANVKLIDSLEECDVVNKLTKVERECIAEDYRLRGNDYFRAKEYDNAVNEYNRSIMVFPENAAPALNNRAAAKIKLKRYSEAIKDCEQCLQLEPDNLKARLRLAEATYLDGSRKESYALYQKVLEVDPQNAVALKAIAELKGIYGELPPSTATRIQIQECSSTKNTKSENISKNDKKLEKTGKLKAQITSLSESSSCTSITNSSRNKTERIDYDLSDLIKPKHLVKNKLATAAAVLSNIKSNKTCEQQKTKSKTANPKQSIQQTTKSKFEIKLPGDMPAKTNGKILIQEI